MKHLKSSKTILAVLSMCLLLASFVLYTGAEETKEPTGKEALMKKDPVSRCETYCERYKNEIEYMSCMYGCMGAAEIKKRRLF